MNNLVYDSAPFESVRSVDDNGFLHVAVSNISKEQVVPYAGREIPNSEAHGFLPDHVYYGYRPGAELSKDSTVNSLNGIPILLNHHPDFSDAPQKKYRVGSTGTDAKYEEPYLTNSLHIQDEDAIRRIKDGSMKELSLGYRYTPVFQTGEFNGTKYDFIMTDISCNHVALVERGRAGHDVSVGDSKTIKETTSMDEAVEKAEVALAESVANSAQALIDLHEENPATEEVQDIPTTSDAGENIMEEVETKDSVREELIKECADAGLDPEKVKAKLEILETPDKTETKEEVEAEDEDTEIEETEKVTEDEDEAEEEIALDAETAKACGLDADDPDIQKAFAEGVKYGERKEKEEPKKLDSEHESEGEEKFLAGDSAMQIANLVKKQVSAQFKAAEDCKRTLGKIDAMAFDSAGAIYRTALKREGISTKGMNDVACRATYLAITSVKSKGSNRMAMDSALKDKQSAMSSYFNRVNKGV